MIALENDSAKPVRLIEATISPERPARWR